MAILYVETNLAVGIAKGQDHMAEALLDDPPTGLRMVMPGVCVMEAFSVLVGIVRNALTAAGVDRYFTRAGAVLGWYQAQSA